MRQLISLMSVLVLILPLQWVPVQTANILCLLGVPMPSHHIWNKALLSALADRGHNLTILTVEDEISAPRLNFIQMEKVYESLMNFSDSFGEIDFTQGNAFTNTKEHYKFHNFISKRFVKTAGVKQLLDYSLEFPFDLIIHDVTLGQSLLGYVEYFGNPPLIGVSPGGIPSNLPTLTGASVYSAYMPHFSSLLTAEMDIMERLKNSLYHSFDWFYRRYIYMMNENRRARSIFGKNFSVAMEEIECKTAIVLINSDFSLDYVQNLPPNVVTVGGLQVKRNEIFDPVIKFNLYFSLFFLYSETLKYFN